MLLLRKQRPCNILFWILSKHCGKCHCKDGTRAGLFRALFFFDDTGLYGRYWGALKEIDGLHFACCYFEGIEFAIAHQLALFNPGTQGEHKILRGFEPTYCRSHHTLRHTAFHRAVADFLHRETPHIGSYFNQARNALPFNKEFVPTLKTTSVTAPNDDT